MSTQVKTAVILAAGMGTRLKEAGQAMPKGFIRIDRVPIIERSIGLLRKSGITKIYIGTGYMAHYYEDLRPTYPFISTVHNPEFAVTGSLFTLYQFKNVLAEPFLLLESDLLFETRAVSAMCGSAKGSAILASGFTRSGDEVYIQRSASGRLENLSKRKADLTHCDCELVGINRITPETFKVMMDWAAREFEAGHIQKHYEEALVIASQESPIPVKVIEDLLWCEIDDASHLQRALEVVYPKIASQA
jgi:2-aminoethylphosphonate-pyruvate transaminase